MLEFDDSWERNRIMTRLYYIIAGIGFGLTGYSSIKGGGPKWPNHYTWAVIAMATMLSTVLYAICQRQALRQLMVATVVVSSSARMIGWLLTPGQTVSQKCGSAGILVITLAFILVINVETRDTLP